MKTEENYFYFSVENTFLLNIHIEPESPFPLESSKEKQSGSFSVKRVQLPKPECNIFLLTDTVYFLGLSTVTFLKNVSLFGKILYIFLVIFRQQLRFFLGTNFQFS